MDIQQVATSAQRAAVRELFTEYLTWANHRLAEEYGISFEIDTIIDENMAELHIFLPPTGRLLLAEMDNQVAGLICLKQHTGTICEIKRMYVRPSFRRQGVGRRLVLDVLAEARSAGYTQVRLDSARFMHGAHALYRSLGFHDIPPYPESEIPPEHQHNWVFMERKL